MESLIAKTKIVATIGPACSDADTISQMIRTGLDVVRLNFSHGSHSEHEKHLEGIGKAVRATGKEISILADLCGPKIRTGDIPEPFEIKGGEELIITTREITGCREMISTSYPRLHLDAKPGDKILIDDGLIQLSVESIEGEELHCRVIDGGVVKSHKGMNLPGIDLQISAVTEKDREDLKFILDHDIDYVALSFVRNAEDIATLISLMETQGKRIPIVAKMEKPEAIENMEEIIDLTDMVMVARGDLGVEMPAEQVPSIQKTIIQTCIEANKPVITATQMLDSMINNPRPTRAEVSDVANAVFDGSDAVMLSGETSVGAYPIEAVRMMHSIINSAETHPDMKNRQQMRAKPNTSDSENLCRAAVMMAQNAGAKALLTITLHGKTAFLLSKYRPRIPIIAFTENPSIQRYLNIVWGVRPFLIDEVFDTDTTLKYARDRAIEWGFVKPGNKIVYATGIPLLEAKSTNMVKIETIE